MIGGEDQPRLAGERARELGGVAGIAADHRGRHAELALGGVDRRHRVAERGVRRQVEADGHRRELLVVRDHQRRGGVHEARERRERHLHAAGAGHVEPRQRVGIALILRHRLQDDAVLVRLRVDGRDLALAEGRVERVVDGLQRHAEPAGELAVDVHIQPQALVLRLGGDVAHDRRGLQPLRQPVRPQAHLLGARCR